MIPTDDRHVLLLLQESLALWKAEGTIESGLAPLAATIHMPGGNCIQVLHAADDEIPIRWWVKCYADHDTGVPPASTRPCTSAVGLLRSVRTALGRHQGMRLSIAPNVNTKS